MRSERNRARAAVRGSAALIGASAPGPRGKGVAGRLARWPSRRRASLREPILCQLSRLVGRLVWGEPMMLCTGLHDRGWTRTVVLTDLICYQREGMSHHCARMAELDSRLARLRARGRGK